MGVVVEAELIALGARSAADPVCFLEIETDGIPVEKVLAIKERLMEAVPVQDPPTLLFEFGPLSDVSTALAEPALPDFDGLPLELDETPAGLPPTPITI